MLLHIILWCLSSCDAVSTLKMLKVTFQLLCQLFPSVGIKLHFENKQSHKPKFTGG